MELPNLHSMYIPGIAAALNVAMDEDDRTLVQDLMRNWIDESTSEGKVILESGSLWMENICFRTFLDSDNSCLGDNVSHLYNCSSLHQCNVKVSVFKVISLFQKLKIILTFQMCDKDYEF